MRAHLAQQAVANMRRKAFIAVFGLVVFTSIVLTFWEFYTDFTTKDAQVVTMDRFEITPAKKFTNSDNSAFVFLALGAQANQMNCPAAIESLVRYAGWGGDVYMLTDRPSCFDSDLIVKNARMDPKKFHMSIVDEDFGGGGFDFDHPTSVGLRKSRVRSFTMKTRIFDYIPDPSITVAAYVDCDMIFAIEGCAKSFIESGPDWGSTKIKFGRVHISNDTQTYGDLLGVHAGTMVAHRTHSAEALKEWRYQMEHGDMEGDNDAFFDAYQRVKKERGVAVHPMQPGELTKGIEGNTRLANRYEKFLNPLNPKVYCMNHISKARCVDYSRDAVQQFVDRFRLRTYEGKYFYCVHSVLQPILYGWFPVNYLPYCPKLEMIL